LNPVALRASSWRSTTRSASPYSTASSAVTASTLAADLPITRRGVAKHLAALRRAKLVRAERVGRETRYQLDGEPLEDAARWIAEVGAEWDARLSELQRLLDRRR
jgi:DNA-binding transcriptional ArsR family regulator